MSENKIEYFQGIEESERRAILGTQSSRELKEMIEQNITEAESIQWKQWLIDFIIQFDIDKRGFYE